MSPEPTLALVTEPQSAAPATASEVARLEHHLREVTLKFSDLKLQRDQLVAQQVAAPPSEAGRFNSDIARVNHEYVASALERDATQSALEQARGTRPAIATTQPAQTPPLGRQQLEFGLLGAFFLLLPLSLAFARRLWMRSSLMATRTLPEGNVVELQRLQQAVESIALEVERIGEGQRFTTRLLVEHRAEAVPRHDPPAMAPVRREVGSITPH